MKTTLLIIFISIYFGLFSQSQKNNRPNIVYHIHGLGSWNTKVIFDSWSKFTRVFNVEVDLQPSLKINSSELTEEGFIDLKKLSCLDYQENHIYVTTYQMRLNGLKIQGYRKNGNIVVNDLDKRITTLYHEFAHTFGIEHCDNTECIMFIKETGATWFCEKCEKLIKHKLR